MVEEGAPCWRGLSTELTKTAGKLELFSTEIGNWTQGNVQGKQGRTARSKVKEGQRRSARSNDKILQPMLNYTLNYITKTEYVHTDFP